MGLDRESLFKSDGSEVDNSVSILKACYNFEDHQSDLGNKWRKKKIKSEILFMKFLRFFCLKLSKGKLACNIAKGRFVRHLMTREQFISILNPFIIDDFRLDYGLTLRKREVFDNLVNNIKYFYEQIATCKKDDVYQYLLDLFD